MQKRDDAFSITINDPDLIDESAIIAMENINDALLLIFKENTIYKLLTADSTDPQKTQPDTGHTYEKIAAVGAASPYVARIFLQFKSIIDQVLPEDSIKPKLLEQVWNLNEQLLLCAQFESNIREQLDEVMQKCDIIIEQNKSSRAIPPLAKVKNLENDAKSFLLVGKQFIIDCFKLINLFTDLPLGARDEAHFDKHIKWLEQNRPTLKKLSLALGNDLFWIRRLSECRNALEHPGPGQSLTIENTKLYPGNKFSLPTWSYDLTNKINVQESSISIHQELDAYLNNMFYFLEEILLFCISERLPDDGMFSIYQHDEADIKPNCPIKYYASLSSEFYSRLKPF
ncbi:hypothetical protein [Pseudomonas proteolytica]|uniref:hypothetical protein n=1 Tax=Pseudomonas proteolytica TaxID=219574 RepID=UPI0014766C8A|nr:hypothetical protein [Pseudomonas proteolytica]NMZ37504.1 hypothetical protein [Pseudomonas proteolytica]NMZ39241.1 hypothetical protein [Pseudomonas proteolytica]